MPQKLSNDNQIEKIFLQLKSEKDIGDKTSLIPKKGLKTFDSHPFFKQISYDPNFSNWGSDEIKYCLLHEEGHIVKAHYGSYFRTFLAIFGVILIGGGLFFAFNQILISIGIILFVFCTRLSSKSLEIDEYRSDEFACRILHDKYQISKPSQIVESVLYRLKNLQGLPITNGRTTQSKWPQWCIKFWEVLKKIWNYLIVPLTDYYPQNSLRVTNIIHECDEKDKDD